MIMFYNENNRTPIQMRAVTNASECVMVSVLHMMVSVPWTKGKQVFVLFL